MMVHLINLRGDVLLHFTAFYFIGILYLCYTELSNCPFCVEFE